MNVGHKIAQKIGKTPTFIPLRTPPHFSKLRWGGLGFHLQWDMALFCWWGPHQGRGVVGPWLGGSISDTIRFLGGANPKIKKQMLFVGGIQYGGFLKWWLPQLRCMAPFTCICKGKLPTAFAGRWLACPRTPSSGQFCWRAWQLSLTLKWSVCVKDSCSIIQRGYEQMGTTNSQKGYARQMARSHAQCCSGSVALTEAFLMCCDHCRASGGFPWKQSYDLFFRICGTFFCRPASRPKKLDQWVHLCLGGSDVCYRPMHPPGYASRQQIPRPLCWKNCRTFRQWDPLSHPTSETLLRPLVCLSGAIRGMASRKGWSQRHSVAIWLDAVGWSWRGACELHANSYLFHHKMKSAPRFLGLSDEHEVAIRAQPGRGTQQLLVFLLKMTILGRGMGVPPF